MIGYHFTGKTLRDGKPLPRVGETLRHLGPIMPCESGLHMNLKPWDALAHAPGPFLHLVELRGDLVPSGDPIDKYVGRERIILASIDATELLRDFARAEALKVAHLWDCPDIVKKYLITGDKTLRDAASSAAWAAGAAAWAADAVVREASAAASAATGAADTAVREARGAAWAAAGAASAVTRDAWVAARDAAWEAAEDAFNNLVYSAFGEKP